MPRYNDVAGPSDCTVSQAAAGEPIPSRCQRCGGTTQDCLFYEWIDSKASGGWWPKSVIRVNERSAETVSEMVEEGLAINVNERDLCLGKIVDLAAMRKARGLDWSPQILLETVLADMANGRYNGKVRGIMVLISLDDGETGATHYGSASLDYLTMLGLLERVKFLINRDD